jgi:hypothetical protein
VEDNSQPSKAPVAVAVPVYKPSLDGLHLFSLQYSLNKLEAGREVFFVCPESLDRTFYSELFPSAGFKAFDDGCFASISAYSNLLLTCPFYERFGGYEYILLTQTDALILRDELDYWCGQGYDYIGAPWLSDGTVYTVNTDRYKGQDKKVRCLVGNGGFSLRRVDKCIWLLNQFPEAVGNWRRLGVNEDLFFSIFGALSDGFSIPDSLTASKFSLEMIPDYYYELNSYHAPMGGHGWWRYDLDFWFAMLGRDAAGVRRLASEAFNAVKADVAEYLNGLKG